ncbi:MAG TPA: ABC transporter permease, partial [Longimicrobiaceae bacterium]|nr:ABC transporter permease [Longimicrobiaceae bacterium]
MSGFGALARLAWRESRFARRRLLLFLSSISLGVAALVATQSFAANLAEGVRDQARAMVGADLQLSSNRKFGPETEKRLAAFRRRGVPVVRVTSFGSMALLGRTGATRLAQVRAPEPGYPFYGNIETAPAGRWASLHAGRNALVDPALLTALDGRVGDSISLGDARFRVIGTVEKVPGQVGIGSLFAPAVYVPARYVPEMNLLRFGARVDYDAYVRMPPAEAARFVTSERPALRRERTTLRTPEQEQRQLGRAMEQLGDFLGLVGTFALLLGGIGVASAMGAYMAQKRETVAALRCLGATAPQVAAVYLMQAAVMGLAGAVLGALIGVGVQWILPRLLADLLPVQVGTTVDLPAVLTGVGVGLWIAIAFALLPLLATRRVSPLEAIRRRVEPAKAPRDAWTWGAALLLAASVAGLVVFEAGSVGTGIGFAAGIGVTLLGLWLAAWLVTRLARRRSWPGLPFPARQGLANLHRPGNQTRVVVLALGFGVFLLATLYLTQGNLLRPLRLNAAASRANLLIFDVQGEQQPGLDAQLRAERTVIVQAAPIVPMRIYSINGKTTAQLVGPGAARDVDEPPPDRDQKARRAGPEPWAVRREYRSTFRDTVNASETLVQGKFWKPGAGAPARGPAEVSLDQGILDDLDVKLGDE